MEWEVWGGVDGLKKKGQLELVVMFRLLMGVYI